MNPVLLSLKPVIGNQRTLIIACHECELEEEHVDNVFFYTTLGNMLHRHDYLQQDIIRHHIEEKGCTQIIVCGHLHCGVLDHLLNDNSSRSALTLLQFNLIKLLGDHDPKFLSAHVREQILVELNIIQQCSLLMEYEFIREQVAMGNLKITGVIIGSDERAKKIYSDGFYYNNLISLN